MSLPAHGLKSRLVLRAWHAGLPEKGKVFCERTSFPEDALFLDLDRVAYRELALYEGIGRTFFNLATPKVLFSPCMLWNKPHGFLPGLPLSAAFCRAVHREPESPPVCALRRCRRWSSAASRRRWRATRSTS